MSPESNRLKDQGLARFKSLVNGIRDYAFILLDKSGTITSWNTGAERILGYTEAEVIDHSFALIFTPEDRESGSPERELRIAAETGCAEDERWHQRKDGARFWASGLTNSILEENSEGLSELIGFAKIVRDQTNKRLQEEEQQRLSEEISRERLRLTSLIGSIPGVVWESARPHNLEPTTKPLQQLAITYISPYVETLLGYEAAMFIGKKLDDSIESGDSKSLKSIFLPTDEVKALGHGSDIFQGTRDQKLEYRLVRKDGRVIWVESHAVAVRDIQGNPIGMRGVILDVTDRKQAEVARENAVNIALHAQAEAEESEKRYKYLAEAMPQIVFVSDANGKTEYYNRKWHEFTGQTPGNEDADAAIHPQDAAQLNERWSQSAKTGLQFESQFRLRNANGAYHWFLTRSVPLRNSQGEIIQWIGTCTDIEEQKRSEEGIHFLAQASEILAGSLDYHETLKRVAELAVPRIADWCSVEIVNEKGSTEQLAVAHVDPEKIRWALEINEKYPSDPNALTGVPKVIRTGKSEFYPYISEEMLRAAAIDEEHWRIIQEIGFTSVIIVPLKARDIVFGAITLVTAEAKRQYTDQDLKLAEDLGRRAATAVDNAWLYQKAQQEIIERKQTEEALRESEERSRIVAVTATDAIVTIDEQSTILFVNPSATKIFGYAVEEMTGQKVTMLMPELYRKLHETGLNNYLESGKRHIDWEAVELPGLHKAGYEIPLEISFGEFTQDGHHSFTGIIRDITERKRVESELRMSESRFRTMIEQSPLGIQLFDLEGFCIQANSAWEQLWGADRKELEGYNIRNDTRLAQLEMGDYVERAYSGEAVALPPIHYDPADIGRPGRPRWIRTFLYPVRNEEQGILELAVIIEDITERRQAEEELRKAKERAEANEKQLAAANAAKDHFLAILSHELRTPLTPVMATVQALQAEKLSDDIRPWLEIIQRNVELEARLIDDLLDLTRITKGKLQLNIETVDAHSLVRNVVEIYRNEIQEKGLSLSLELEAEEHWVMGDPARLQQVFWNLVKNAVKFTPEAGKLIIHSSNSCENNGQVLRIEFTDTGIGIGQDVLPKIFDAFEQGEKTVTRNFGGLGLGLAISKSLVEMHGGELLALSPGLQLGATFIVELASARTPMEKRESVESNVSQDPLSKPIILLIDDHVDTSTAIKMLLERQGYEVRVANNASQALALAHELAFDLIVSDIGLPDESGLTLIHKLRAIRHTPAIALSGFGTEEDVIRSHDAGFDEHLTKPFNLQQLRDTIKRLLQP